jgi:homoserine dehydrogenase
MERVRIGIVGFGTVGQSFYKLLTCNAGEFAQRLGVSVEVPYVGVRDLSKPHPVGTGTRLVTGWQEMLSDASLPIIVELVGGIDVPLALIRDALSRGKHVITANKALISAHGQELFELAGKNGVELKFEGAVCGGIPIIKVLRESLLGNRVTSLIGIVNGTTNYILTRMTEDKLSFAEALALAQKLGFAEADPSLDIGGKDAAQKIGILASLAFGCWVDPDDVLCEGITDVTSRDIEFCLQSGFIFKLIARAQLLEGKPLVTVFPMLVPADHPLASVRNEFNAVLIDSDFLGPSVYEGRGAGGKPTASSVASDLGDLLKSILSRHVARRRASLPKAEAYPAGKMSCRYYFHFVTANRPGIWALVTGICAEDGINIESVHQKWEDKSKPSDLYVLVDEAQEDQVHGAFARIVASGGIFPQSHYFRVLPGPAEGGPS